MNNSLNKNALKTNLNSKRKTPEKTTKLLETTSE